jgi:16S rRNA processing protein RimM
MTKEDCFNLGYITKRIGRNNELTFFLDVDNPDYYKNLKSVFVEINESLIPFFISKIKITGSNAKVSVEGIDSIEKAEDIIRTGLYLPLTELPQLDGKHFYFHEMPGFKAIDKSYGAIGIVEEVLDLKRQAVFQINDGTNEILIPAEEQFIIKIDRNLKEIHFDAPQGLIDLYIKED